MCDEIPLKSKWDMDRVLDFSQRELDSADDDEEKNAQHPYLYEQDTVVLLHPGRGAPNKVYLAKVIDHGVGDRKGEYSVHYLTSQVVYGTYKPAKHPDGRPFMSWEYEESGQDDVKMIKKGTRLSAMATTSISHWVDRWAQEQAQEDGLGEDPQDMAADQRLTNVD